jgi:L-asparagine oxygenase
VHTNNTEEVAVAPELAAALSQAITDQASDSAMFYGLRREIETTVAHQGWAVVRGIPFDPDNKALLLIGSWFGHPVRYLDQPLVRSLEPDPGLPETAYYAGTGNVELHTDKAFVETPPHFVLLHCARPDQQGGGDVLLSKASDSFDRLPPRVQEALRMTPIEVAIPAHIDRDTAPVPTFVAESMGSQLRIRLRADLLRKPPSGDFSEALTQLCAFARESAQRVALAPGTLLVVDNWAALHGRTALQSGTDSTRLCRRLLIA